jgi:LPS-assembly lipoprotein
MQGRRTLILSALALGACGFRPVHAPGGAGAALQGQVRAADPATRAEQQFVAALEDRLGRADRARFDLAYVLTVTPIEGGRIQGLGATRIVLAGGLDFTLTEGGLERARGRVSAESAYSTTATQLAALTAEDDAQARLMQMLADALISRLLADPALAG